ncbi:hypothetical protein LT679_08895 [Mucilaginibacter roseus]|uniref:Lipoprotein n=1 Tax=Mucilaginibacter roseus TaxID=1528868 RepID=A0ABS8U0S3_9SPHI|nr:hypothetical protein [Mucilaginibacter roseus]MCD8740713.1 hypothetical protein [Mucilaginibacter roseus]
MKKLFLSALAVGFLAFSSCKKDASSTQPTKTIQDEVVLTNGRLQFKDSKTLNNVISKLINKGTDYWNNWERDLKFKSLRNDSLASEKFESFVFPSFYKTIINPKGEYMVGDTIVWFNNGYKYLIPNKDEALLAKTKTNPDAYNLKFAAGDQPINSSGKLTTQSTQLGGGKKDARYQLEFIKDGDPNSKRKIVFEIYNYVEQGIYNIHYIHTLIKLEYLGGNKPGNWKPASETMEKRISNLSFDIAFAGTGTGATAHATGSNINTGTQIDGINLDYVLCTFQSTNKTVNATVNGQYYAKVLAPQHSAGIYTVNSAW